MKLLARSSNIQYAVIEVCSTHYSSERLVLAYADEKSLRSLIAEPSIVALGFASRSAAAAAVADSFQQGIPSQQMHGMPALELRNQRFPLGVHFGMSRLMYWKAHSVVYRAVHFAVATVFLVLHSRNIVSATLRTVLGV